MPRLSRLQRTTLVKLWLDNTKFVGKTYPYILLCNMAKIQSILISPLGARNIIQKYIKTGTIGNLRNTNSDIANTKITEQNLNR